ncbi:MAG: quinolinate synthase NadA [Candidatus Latescibacteria bacterium]|nr:quinolinate synthase NadA [bacterium]MBD3424825.1 quinolinate synthase NadA [Candidatus Latescibacterota bacterium]
MLSDTILALKKEKNLAILAHNYQPPEIQDLADHLGDSLALSRLATEIESDRIIFCGVFFMAETAAILSPEKKIILPEPEAGCPLADMITAESLVKLKQKHPQATVITYVNSPAEVKAVSDICCTSANALNIVRSVPESEEVIFGPDKHLGRWVGQQAGRELILWEGFCPVHQKFSAEWIAELREKHPGAEVLVHPEVPPEIEELSDHTLGTGGMIRRAGESSADTFIIGTEKDMVYRLKTIYPSKTFIPASLEAICRNMKKITLEKLLHSAETLEPVITVPAETADAARGAIEKMVRYG